jgi:hypothetical protein
LKNNDYRLEVNPSLKEIAQELDGKCFSEKVKQSLERTALSDAIAELS